MADPVSTPDAVRAMAWALEAMLDVDTEDDGALATALEVVEVALVAWRSRVPLADDEEAWRAVHERAHAAHRASRFTGDPQPTTVVHAALAALDARLSGEG